MCIYIVQNFQLFYSSEKSGHIHVYVGEKCQNINHAITYYTKKGWKIL